MTNSFPLNPQQTEAVERLSNFDKFFVLKGYAGTGKTTTITRWVEQVRQRPKDLPFGTIWNRPNIVLTAPTNKAAGVLREMAKKIRLPVDVSTIHSLLSLKMQWDKDQQILVPDPRGEDRFGEYTHVVIDECSMLDKQMMEHIRAAQERNDNRVIFMGDPCQLPPIGEAASESFNISENSIELTQIMRQADGNPIPELGAYLRELVLSGGRAYPAKLYSFVDDKHILLRPANEFRDEILEAFAEGERDIRSVAWTNRTVDAWNNQIRDRLYGDNRDEWTKGEQIVTTAPVIDPIEKSVLVATDTLLKIEAEPREVEKFGVPCWSLATIPASLLVPKASAKKAFAEEKKLRLEAAKTQKGKWREFYDFMEAFAWVKPAHALTVHRSQGSTFDDAYVSFNNILQNPRRKESLQCLYVACTRPRERLFLV